MGREVSISGRNSEQEGIVPLEDIGCDDGIAGLGRSVHLIEDFLGECFGDSKAVISNRVEEG